MKKKVFYQVSIILYIGLVLFVAIMAACVYVAIEFLRVKINSAGVFEWAVFVAAIAGIIFLVYTIVRMAKNKILLEDKEIYVPEHWGSKDHKIQYETHIGYSDVKEIFIISSDKNSLNKSIRFGFATMPYIVFNCKNDSQKSINVFYFSKKQVIQIIDEAILRAKKQGNELQIKTGEEIFSEFLSTKRKNNS